MVGSPERRWQKPAAAEWRHAAVCEEGACGDGWPRGGSAAPGKRGAGGRGRCGSRGQWRARALVARARPRASERAWVHERQEEEPHGVRAVWAGTSQRQRQAGDGADMAHPKRGEVRHCRGHVGGCCEQGRGASGRDEGMRERAQVGARTRCDEHIYGEDSGHGDLQGKRRGGSGSPPLQGFGSARRDEATRGGGRG